MNRQQTIKELETYFKIQELVCPHTYNKWKDKSWNFLDTAFLETLLVLRRDILKVSMIANDYLFNGKHTQRGLRCNLCQLVKDKTNNNRSYLSQHLMGKASDFVFKDLTADNARRIIQDNKNHLPHKIRIEDNVTWLHFDVMDYANTTDKITLFTD